ncbi:hypothetical protein O181_033931 [Austropuccinia psidii MF-1]|uniref:Uncharacterized protein n=1 Tax=Austropuccinia psidii MF-1 TaxID=1389203 RepID=A0A9Q3H7J0_9BASI|nr:hypothetical protein [Austropuccinia psidii MF-1]
MEPHIALTNSCTSICAIQLDLDDDDPDIIDARHISKIDYGKILIESDSSAPMRRESSFLFYIKTLRQPIPLLLADSKAVLQATAQGRLSIPMINGTFDVKNVYICESI